MISENHHCVEGVGLSTEKPVVLLSWMVVQHVIHSALIGIFRNKWVKYCSS